MYGIQTIYEWLSIDPDMPKTGDGTVIHISKRRDAEGRHPKGITAGAKAETTIYPSERAAMCSAADGQ